MPENKLHSLEKIGYTKNVPEVSDLDNFETISVKSKSGATILNQLVKFLIFIRLVI